jgi:hypothetical protein
MALTGSRILSLAWLRHGNKWPCACAWGQAVKVGGEGALGFPRLLCVSCGVQATLVVHNGSLWCWQGTLSDCNAFCGVDKVSTAHGMWCGLVNHRVRGLREYELRVRAQVAAP